MKKYISNCIESNLFSVIIQFLILLSISLLALETMPSVRKRYIDSFHIIEIIFTVIFTFEYLARVFASQKKLKFIFSFYGLVDLISVLPSILAFGILDFRFFRSLRLIRVFRVLKLARYNKAVERLKGAFVDIKEELLVFSALALIILFISASGIYYFENQAQPEVFKSIPHSLWWAVATLTTVGYGDVYPVTAGGKIFTSVILFIGLSLVTVPTGLFASAFSKENTEE